jgi:hypothetical protein
MTTSLNTYTNVTEAQIVEALQPLGFVKIDLENTHEVVLSKRIEFEGAPTIVRVYTGVLKSTGESRPSGQDAIRVCLGRLIDDRVRIFKTLQTVRRIGTWKKHLLERIAGIGNGLVPAKPALTERDLLDGRNEPAAPPLGAELECPSCGAKMVGPKRGKHGPFYGCSRFPACRGLRNV